MSGAQIEQCPEVNNAEGGRCRWNVGHTTPHQSACGGQWETPEGNRNDQTLRDYIAVLVKGWRDGTYTAEDVISRLDEVDQQVPARPFSEMADNGVLWAVNRTLFHPRGFALWFGTDEHGVSLGWGIDGDGTEPWSFGPDIDEVGKMRAFEALLERQRHPLHEVPGRQE